MRSIRWFMGCTLITACAGVDPADAPAAADVASSMRFAGSWSTGGCGDITLYGHNRLDTRAFFVSLPGMAQDSHQSGAIHQSFRLPSTDVRLSAEDGRRLTSATCVGAYPLPGPRVTRSWEAVSGVVVVDVVPVGRSPEAEASITARNVVFSDGAGSSFTVSSLRVPATSVGFYPP